MNTLYCFENRSAPFVDVFQETARRSGFAVVLQAPSQGIADFHAFRRRYVHLSVNPEGFELACFLRHFAMRDMLSPGERAIMADSDLFLQGGPAAIPSELTADPHGFVGSRGVADGRTEDQISPHFSFWTHELLADFCSFLLEQYGNKIERLRAHYARIKANDPRAAISDMTLLDLWVGDRAIPFIDSNQVFGGTYIDHNISTPEAGNARFATTFGRKRLILKEDGVLLQRDGGQLVMPIALHLQGRYKLASQPLANRDRLKLWRASAYIAGGRMVRGMLSMAS